MPNSGVTESEGVSVYFRGDVELLTYLGVNDLRPSSLIFSVSWDGGLE